LTREIGFKSFQSKIVEKIGEILKAYKKADSWRIELKTLEKSNRISRVTSDPVLIL